MCLGVGEVSGESDALKMRVSHVGTEIAIARSTGCDSDLALYETDR